MHPRSGMLAIKKLFCFLVDMIRLPIFFNVCVLIESNDYMQLCDLRIKYDSCVI